MSERKIRKIGVTNFPSSRRVRGRKANVVRNPNYKAGPNGQNPRGYHPECPGYRACVISGGTMGSIAGEKISILDIFGHLIMLIMQK